jgi:phage terminase small subunit
MGDSSRPLRLVPPGGGDGTVPAHWPECPAYLSGSQQRRFFAVCQRLDDQGTLETADVSVIEALAIAEDNLEVTTAYTNAGERYATVIKEGRPYQCTTCKGTGLRPLPKGAAAVPDVAQAPSAPTKLGHRPCSICTSDHRAAIDAALKRGDSLGAVSKAFDTTLEAVARHRRNHLGGDDPRPVLVDPASRVCPFCGGRGSVFPKLQEVITKGPATTDQRHAIDQVAMLSAKLGLDVASRVRVKGKATPGKVTSGLQALRDRRANHK